jgi:hypothetical protein
MTEQEIKKELVKYRSAVAFVLVMSIALPLFAIIYKGFIIEIFSFAPLWVFAPLIIKDMNKRIK